MYHPLEKFIRKPEIRAITGLSDSTIWRMEQQGAFPCRRKISNRNVAWLASEVVEWVNKQEKVAHEE